MFLIILIHILVISQKRQKNKVLTDYAIKMKNFRLEPKMCEKNPLNRVKVMVELKTSDSDKSHFKGLCLKITNF